MIREKIKVLVTREYEVWLRGVPYEKIKKDMERRIKQGCAVLSGGGDYSMFSGKIVDIKRTEDK